MSSNTANALVFNGVTKQFGTKKVINDLNLTVHAGEIFVIIGPSGTGKSVTLKLASGQLTPTAGSITLLGEDWRQLSSSQAFELRRKMGFLFQSGALLGWKTLAENIALPLLERGALNANEIRHRVDNVLAEVGLAQAGNLYPAEVSGGMIKRAAFARAVIEDPQLLLFDEPTSGLDPVMSRTIDRLILKLNQTRPITSIVVTHDLAGALQYATRIGFLKEGHFLEIATPDVLRKSTIPEIQAFLKAQFIGENND